MKHFKILLPLAQLYLTLALIFGTWVIYIPQITARLNMSEGDLGIALFFGAIGGLGGIPIGKQLTTRLGEGKTSFYVSLLLVLLISNIILSPTYIWFCIAWAIYGIASGIMQVSINSLVAAIEQMKEIKIMSTCHGFYSMGGIISTGLGTVLIIVIDNITLHVIGLVIVVFLLQLLFGKKFYHIRKEKLNGEKKSFSLKIFKSMALIGMASIVLIIWLTESAIADWSSLFLQNVALTKTEYAGLGYAGFSLSMTIGRFMGDRLRSIAGPWELIITGISIGVVGFLIVLGARPVLSVGGFFVIGLGFSIIIPEVFRLSSNLDGVSPSSGIAFIAGAGNVGFLMGPVMLGLIAEHFSLSKSFMALIMLVVSALVISIGMYSSSKRIAKAA